MHVQDLRLKVTFVVVRIHVFFFSLTFFSHILFFLDTNRTYIGIFSHPVVKIATSVRVLKGLFQFGRERRESREEAGLNRFVF